MSTVALDLDGVIGNYINSVLRLAEKLGWGVPGFTHDRWNTWWGERSGLSKEQITFLQEHTDLFRRELPYEDALLGIRELYGAGYSVEIVTDRFCYPEIERDTVCWVDEHLSLYAPIVHFVRSENKPGFLKERGFCTYLDDRAETVLACKCEGIPAFLLRRPWTETHVNPVPVTWREFTQQVIQSGGNLSTCP